MKIHPQCSYYNPCSKEHANAPKLFHKLDSSKKCLVILATIFASLGTFFMGGLGGAAVFRHLVYKWSKKDSTTTKTSEVIEKTLPPIKNQQQEKKEEPTKPIEKVISPEPIVSEQAVQKAKTKLVEYFKSRGDIGRIDMNISYNSGGEGGGKYQFNKKDLIADFIIRNMLVNKNMQESSIINFYIEDDNGEDEFISPYLKVEDVSEANTLFISLMELWWFDHKQKYFETIDFENFKSEYLKLISYFKGVLGIQEGPLDPSKIKETILFLDNVLKSISGYPCKNIMDREVIEKLKSSIIYFAYPVKIFLELYYQYEHPDLAQYIHELINVPKDLATLITQYNVIEDIFLIRDLVIKPVR